MIYCKDYVGRSVCIKDITLTEKTSEKCPSFCVVPKLSIWNKTSRGINYFFVEVFCELFKSQGNLCAGGYQSYIQRTT